MSRKIYNRLSFMAVSSLDESTLPYPRRQLTLEHGFSSLTLSLSLTVLHYLF